MEVANPELALPGDCFRNQIAQNILEDRIDRVRQDIALKSTANLGPVLPPWIFQSQTEETKDFEAALEGLLTLATDLLSIIFDDTGVAAPESKIAEGISQKKSVPNLIPDPIKEKPPICIIGAGVSGLYAALLLQSLGLKYHILEASNRLGGRLYTYRFNGQAGIDAPVKDPARYDYIDMGAMRFPEIGFHQRVFDLIHKLGIDDLKVKYEMTADNTLLYYNGQHAHTNDDLTMKSLDFFKVTYLNGGFVPNKFVFKEKKDSQGNLVPDPAQPSDNDGSVLMKKAIGGFIDAFNSAKINPENPEEKPDPKEVRKVVRAAWGKLIKFDAFSTRAFMQRKREGSRPMAAQGGRPVVAQVGGGPVDAQGEDRPATARDDDDEYPALPEAAVEWLESMGAGTGMYNHALVESVMNAVDFGDASATTHAAPRVPEIPEKVPTKWWCLDGGSDRLIMAMLAKLREQGGPEPLRNKRVTAIRLKTPDDENKIMEVYVEGEEKPREYSQVISTPALGCLGSVDLAESKLSYAQKTAIRSLSYLASTKVAIKFKTRWWQDSEFMNEKPIKGGVTSTDLPIRMVVYPSYGLDVKNAPGVLLASYNWAQDAARFGAIAHDHSLNSPLLKLVLKNLATVHKVDYQQLRDQVESFYPYAWYNDENTRGAFGQFGPGQFGSTDQGFSLFASLQVPAAHGRLHFAGEATSIHHAWVLGGLNSAWRAVHNVVLGNEVLKAKLIKDWGIPDEWKLDDLRVAAVMGTYDVL